MAPFTRKALSVIEKLRAPAALYRLSSTLGGGWSETSGVKRNGRVIIQVQENADGKKDSVAVVRFVLRHGQDVLNARILHGLPVVRKDSNTVFFKVCSTSNSRVRCKTIHVLKFDKEEDADDFLMWWYAKNGSIKAWLGEDSNQKISTRKSLKRKAAESTKTGSTPLGKRVKVMVDDDRCRDGDDDCKQVLQPLRESTNSKFDVGESSTKPAQKKKKNIGENDIKDDNENNDSDKTGRSDVPKYCHLASDSEEKEEVMVDYEDVPQSQDWLASF